MIDFRVGDTVSHPEHGPVVITFVGTDRVGVRLGDGRNALFLQSSFEAPETPEGEPEAAAPLPWPESTFVPDGPDAKHYLGSHWEPFTDDSTEIARRLPEICESWKPSPGYEFASKPLPPVPEGWPSGAHMVWPESSPCLGVTLRFEKDANETSSFYPLVEPAGAAPVSFELERVVVWEGGVEAQLRGSWCGTLIEFFDTRYLLHREGYEAGGIFPVALAGLAYSARPAEPVRYTVKRNPDEVAWMREIRKDRGGDPEPETIEVDLAGAAILFPVEGWDIDDYSYRSPVVSVREVKDFLGQGGWFVGIRVPGIEGDTGVLEVLVTGKVWEGAQAPRVGEDIEGRLWLQGHRIADGGPAGNGDAGGAGRLFPEKGLRHG